jgi:hypothetical protein
LLHESLKGVTSFAAKKDILTPWKEADRARREMTVPSGTPDPALRKGMYHRAYNPDRPYLNASEGVARPHRVARPRSEGGEGFTGSLADHVEGAAWESAEHE